MEQPSFALIPSGYNTTTALVYSVLPESGVGDLTLDRSNNTATRINKDGLIEGVNQNIPRLNYEVTNGVVDSCPHLLLEMNSTNSITYSNDLSQTVWAGAGFNNATFGQVGVNGTLNAWLFTKTGASNSDFYNTAFTGTYTFSFFVKKEANKGVKIYNFGDTTQQSTINIETGTYVAGANTVTIQEFPNDWLRVAQTLTISNGKFYLYVTDGTQTQIASSIVVQYFQIEQESYATSYIPTSGSTQSRASESCTGAGDVNTFNSVEGILYAELKRDIATDTGFRRVNINDGSVANTVRLGYSSTTNEIKGVVTVGSATQCALVFAGLSVTSFRKMALLYKANQFELWVDGSKRAEDTSGSTFPTNTLNDLSFQQSNGSDKLRAKVKDVRYYDTDGMTPEEITNLLTQLTQ